MTEKEWRGELEAALAGGLPWRVVSAWCHRGTPLCGAELVHTRNGGSKTVSVSSAAFRECAARKAEVVRQLTEGRN